MNLYDILGVDSSADLNDIKQSFKSKAGKCHPDKNPNDPEATIKFQALVRAYDILKNKEKRERYDQTGDEDNEPTMDEQAVSMISKIFLEIAGRVGFTPQDYLKDIRSHLTNALTKCRRDKSEFARLAERLSYLIKQTEAHPLFLAPLEREVSELRHQMSHAEQGLTVLTHALSLLDTFKYNGKRPEEPLNAFSESGQRPWGDPFIGY